MTAVDPHALSKKVAELAEDIRLEAFRENPVVLTEAFARHILSLALGIRVIEEELKEALKALAPKGESAEIVNLDHVRWRRGPLSAARNDQPGGGVA